jgi:hypothetical protein
VPDPFSPFSDLTPFLTPVPDHFSDPFSLTEVVKRSGDLVEAVDPVDDRLDQMGVHRPVCFAVQVPGQMLILRECLDSTPGFGAFFYGVNQSMQSNAVGEVRCMGCPLGDVLRKRRIEIGQFENAPFELRAGKPLQILRDGQLDEGYSRTACSFEDAVARVAECLGIGQPEVTLGPGDFQANPVAVSLPPLDMHREHCPSVKNPAKQALVRGGRGENLVGLLARIRASSSRQARGRTRPIARPRPVRRVSWVVRVSSVILRRTRSESHQAESLD